MNIHEFQAKEILSRYGVAVADGKVAETPDQAFAIAKELQQQTGAEAWVVKAQIHAGGRGKGGGVKLARNLQEVKEVAGRILGMQLVTPQTGPQGKRVNRVLIQQDLYYKGAAESRELYMSLVLNRSVGKHMLMYSTEGGMDIETVAADTPHLIFREEIHPGLGFQSYQARKVAFNLKLTGNAFKEILRFAPLFYKAFIESDASMIEINPLLKTSDDKILAVDAKISLDDNALFRHPDYESLRDLNEEDPAETEAAGYNLNFVKLSGNVGCMVNGAGLAMATMDIIKLSGGEPANFLDVGGTANAQTVEAGFRIILKDPNVKAILINIFGGIVRCDRVAQGVVEAYHSLGSVRVPVIVRLQGTNAIEAKELIDRSGLKVYSAVTLQEAAELVKLNV